MLHQLSPYLGVFLISILMISCFSQQKSHSHTSENIVIEEAFRTPIIRGPGQSKGLRIGIKATISEGTTLDSISYENLTRPVNKIRTEKDIVWTDAFFYPNQSQLSGDKEFTANKCVLYYSIQKESKSIPISDLTLVTDNTKWK